MYYNEPRFHYMSHEILRLGAIAQLAERLHGMQEVDGSIPFGSTSFKSFCGGLAQLVEHLLCKQGVIGSTPLSSTIPSEFTYISVFLSITASPAYLLYLSINTTEYFTNYHFFQVEKCVLN